jgi:hypothetical protein
MVYLTLRITRRDFVLVMTGNHEDQVHAQWLEQYSLDDAVWWWLWLWHCSVRYGTARVAQPPFSSDFDSILIHCVIWQPLPMFDDCPGGHPVMPGFDSVHPTYASRNYVEHSR